MFQVDRSANQLVRLNQEKFGDLHFREREHLQEWLAKMPDALGEELLIIQKEFDGFAETRERLDLLALDKRGRIVVIENKLDDTGRDVVWQALKYAAYCSSLQKAQIIEIFQKYLDRTSSNQSAHALLEEFYGAEDISEIVLNPGNDQRVILIAANFRKEVTSTVLWLLSNGLDIQCFKVSPFSHGEEVFVDIKQIIPTPEAEEFMIVMSSKDSEERATEDTKNARFSRRLEFWEATLGEFRLRGISRFQNVNPTRDHWLSAGSGLSACSYNLIFSKDEARVEFNMARADTHENKRMFDSLYAERHQIEAEFGDQLVWKRLDDKKSSRVEYAQTFDSYDKSNWPEMIDWLAKTLPRIERAISPRLGQLKSELSD